MEDYRSAIKKLKLQAQQLEQENNELKVKLAMPADEELRIPQFEQILSSNTSQLYIREKVLKELQKCCNERGMTVEMLFRCADKRFTGKLTIQEFKEFLDSFFDGKIDGITLQKVALLFDDDCSGFIMREEFYRVLMYCKCNAEEHTYILNTQAMKMGQPLDDPAKIQERVLEKFIKYVQGLKNTPKGIVEQIDYQQKGYITTDDLLMAMKNNFGSNEIFIIMKYFDIKQLNKVKDEDFLFDLKECLNPNKTAQQLLALRENNTGLRILQDMRKFRQVLRQYKLDPMMIYYQCYPKDVQRKQITDLAISFSKYMKGTQFDQIMNWMRLIDTSQDGAVDIEEFKMAILIEEDLATYQQLKVERQEQIEPTLIEVVIEKMKKKQVGLEEFFDWIDTDKSQIVTVLELRKGFLALNIDIGYVLKLLKLFDKDQKGQVDICEFYEAFGQEYKEETDRIIMKKAAIKLNNLFIKNQTNFVAGMKKLLYTFNQSCAIITCEEFLLAMDTVKDKCNLMDGEIYKMMEFADQEKKNQIQLNSFCNYLYSLL
ncbi:unnamed protein product [Paramecium pentaurelia]|uniref:EF-hand domain-containing protein n=1 Tax=Paramecium pentaurelia TaxID=43138 RepID=A0A8S1WVX5_9CILI|nr:unnamed protein product [Paramecium pentaurelia]